MKNSGSVAPQNSSKKPLATVQWIKIRYKDEGGVNSWLDMQLNQLLSRDGISNLGSGTWLATMVRDIEFGRTKELGRRGPRRRTKKK